MPTAKQPHEASRGLQFELTPSKNRSRVPNPALSASTPWRWLDIARDLSVPICGGLLLGLPYLSGRFSGLAWIAPIAIAWVLYKPRATIALYIGSFYAGLVFGLISMDWLRAAYDGDLLNSWIVIGHLLACLWVGAMWAGRRIVQASSLPAAIVLPTYWVALESVRWHVAGIPVEDAFPLLQLGLTQVRHERLIQIADVGGIATVTWLIVMTSGALFDIARWSLGSQALRQSLPNPKFSAALAIGLLAASWIYGEWRLQQAPDDSGPTVGIVSGRFDLAMSGDSGLTLRHYILDQLAVTNTTQFESRSRPEYPDLLVWQEAAVLHPRSSDSEIGSEIIALPPVELIQPTEAELQKIIEYSRQMECAMVVGAKRTNRNSSRNSVIFVTPDCTEPEYYDKLHLAPWREFRPELARALRLLPHQQSIRTRAAPLQRGDKQRTFSLPCANSTYTFAATICYDLFFPADHQRILNASPGTRFFVGLADEHGARKSTFPRQSLAMQRMRAIECRRSYVRNAGYGISAIIDSRGRPMPTLRFEVNEHTSVELGRLPIVRSTSLYLIVGEILPAICYLCCGILFAFSISTSLASRNRATNVTTD